MTAPDNVLLLGLDFGSTTSAAMIASARLQAHSSTGRKALADFTVVYQSEPVFTPFCGDRLDESAIERLVEGWLTEAGVAMERLFSAGALITGLAAEKTNAHLIGELLRRRIGDAVMAVARDPRLESWFAFMGSAYPLSRRHPERYFLNIDIGGGTANFAWGRAGEVSRLGSQFIGARHFRFEPGTYRLVDCSAHASATLQVAGVGKTSGGTLTEREVEAIVAIYVRALEALAAEMPGIVTFSGGVGELVYQGSRREALPGRTAFGDLGIDLALGILASPILAKDLGRFEPVSRGRATVYGLALHHAVLSGTTLFLPDAERLPLRDLPVVGKLDAGGNDEAMRELLQRVRLASDGGCVQITGCSEKAQEVRALGNRLERVLREIAFPPGHPLVLFVDGNFAKTLGNYITRWGNSPRDLIVIDEIEPRAAHFASLGRPCNGAVPVSFYGIQ